MKSPRRVWLARALNAEDGKMKRGDQDHDASEREVDQFERQFHRKYGAKPRQASPRLWGAAITTFLVYAMMKVLHVVPKPAGKAPAEVLGALLGSALLPFLVVLIASLWEGNRTQRRRVKIFFCTSLALIVLQIVPSVVVLAAFRLPGEPWEYHSQEYGFSLRLPSSRWKQATKKIHLVDFQFNTLSSMLAGVVSVEKQTAEEFAARIPFFKSTMEQQAWRSTSMMEEKAGRSTLPSFQESETDDGNHYVFGSYQERYNTQSRFIYWASCLVWLKDKGKTVRVLVEGHGRMISESFQAAEAEEFEAAARSICRSVRVVKEP
jgi:hypothetical protein